MKNVTLVLTLIVATLLCNCKTKKLVNDQEGTIYLVNGKVKFEQNEDSIDSNVGYIISRKTKMAYDLGPYSAPGPLTPEETFRNEFDAYHHTKFFEKVMIDKKVYKIFLDSVKIVDVRAKTTDDELFFECDPCNAVAELVFKKRTFIYPTNMSDNLLNLDDITFKFEEIDGITYKIYQEKGKSPALYATPTFNRFKKKKTLSVTVVESDLTDEEIINLLQNIRIKEENAFE